MAARRSSLNVKLSLPCQELLWSRPSIRTQAGTHSHMLLYSVKNAQKVLHREEQKLRAFPDYFMTPPGATIVEALAGQFWGIIEARDEHRAIQLAPDYDRNMLRLCLCDNMGFRDVATPHECYDFIKWWSTTGIYSDCDWGDMEIPYLDVKNADPFEPVDKDIMDSPFSVLQLLICWSKSDSKACTLFSMLHSVVGKVVPEENLDNIRSQLVSNIMSRQDPEPLIKRVEKQVMELYKAVHRSSKLFWPSLPNSGIYLNSLPQPYFHGKP